MLQVLLGNVAVWVPLVFGIIWVVRRTGRDLFGRFRIELGDLVFALGIVILARVFDAVLSLSFSGTTGLQPGRRSAPDVGLLLVSAVGIVLISPVLEETVLPRPVPAAARRRAHAAHAVARRLVTAFLFALAHLFLGRRRRRSAGCRCS